MNEISTTPYITAVKLNQRIIVTAQAAQQNLFDMCVMLKRMRDEKLYKELGYQNFEDYCENEAGFSRMQAHKYISIIENVKNVNSSLHFGVTKLALLSTLSEPEQKEIQEKIDLESTSVSKLKEEIKKLKEDQSDITEQVRTERQRAEKAENDLADAEKKIKEFERRPITVVEDEKTKEANEKLKVLLADAEQKLAANDTGDYELKNAKATIRELDKQLSIETQDHANEQNRIRRKYQDEINRLNEQLKKQEENVRTVEIPDMKEVFRAYYQNAINAFNAMINFISGIEGDKEFYLKKSGQLVGKLYDTLEEVK